MSAAAPLLSGIVVHWHNERELAELAAAWPRDPRFELIVIDNGSEAPLAVGAARVIRPGGNIGFGGGVNLGLAASRGAIVLVLNPDARPEPGALDALLTGFAAHPEAGGLAPRLEGADGKPQFAWQLRRLPRLADLLLQASFLSPRLSPATEPPAGTPVEQPAAAVLAMRRAELESVAGFDSSFYPAWFEDVDLAARLRRRQGRSLLYWPQAVFRHGLGASVPRLGYGPFLWIYQRNLYRYTRKHHGPLAAALLALALPVGLALRLAALPLRAPRRAGSRRQAFAGLSAALAGSLSGWRLPSSFARRFSPAVLDPGART